VFDGEGVRFDGLGDVYPTKRRDLTASAINHVSRHYRELHIYRISVATMSTLITRSCDFFGSGMSHNRSRRRGSQAHVAADEVTRYCFCSDGR
jgi:vacuolar-type H+-ATPase subunit B/Vma2